MLPNYLEVQINNHINLVVGNSINVYVSKYQNLITFIILL